MVYSDQPTIFDDKLLVGLSSAHDGNMKFIAEETDTVTNNRSHFLQQLGITLQQTAMCQVTYDAANFTRYDVVLTPDYHEIADALATNQRQLAVFLPLADCTGAVLYDPTQQVFMVSHLGRHSTELFGGRKSVEFMTEHFGSKPSDILVWLSPSPNGNDYPLWAFDNRSFSEVITRQLRDAGVSHRHIEASSVDTVTDKNYFSHSEFLKGNRTHDGRYAIVAMIR